MFTLYMLCRYKKKSGPKIDIIANLNDITLLNNMCRFLR